MKIIPALNNFSRNVWDLGLNYRDAFTIAAIAELTAEKKYCTTPEISRMVGKRKADHYLTKLSFAVDWHEGLNDRGKKTYYYRLNAKGINLLSKLISTNPIKLENIVRECNKTKKRK